MKHLFFGLQTKSKGESIPEILVATVVLVGILTAAFGVLGRASSANINVENRIIAINIAREGMEAVRNIRDTNWLKYSGDKRNKWLCLDTSGLDCNTTFSGNGFYQVDFNDTDKRYYLDQIIGASELDLGTNPSNFGDFQLYQMSDGRLAHDNSGVATTFYRQIELTVENPFDGVAPSFCNTSPCSESRLHVVFRVQWQESGNNVRTVVAEGYLFDFLDRDAY